MTSRFLPALALALSLGLVAGLSGSATASAEATMAARREAMVQRIDAALPPLLAESSVSFWSSSAADPRTEADPAGTMADLEADRAEMLAWVDDMQELQPFLRDFAEPGSDERLRDLRAEIEAMSPQRLALARAQLGSHPGLWQFPALVLAIFETGRPLPPFYAQQAREWASMRGQEARYGLEQARDLGQPIGPGAAGAQPDAVNTPGPTAAPYPTMDPFPPRGDAPERPESRPGCPGIFDEGTCDECGPSIPLEAVFAAKVASLVLKGVRDTVGTPAQDTCAPPGVGFTVPDVVYFIIVGISAGAEALVASLEFVNDLNEECEGGYHAAITDLYLDETISSRVSQASYDAHAELQMRIKIERNLLRQRDDRISLFHLPQAQCGDIQFDGYLFCGKLELVREIVADTIQNNQDAMSVTDLNNAQAELNAGDMHYMSSQWKAAYERYSLAYRFAVKQRSIR